MDLESWRKKCEAERRVGLRNASLLVLGETDRESAIRLLEQAIETRKRLRRDRRGERVTSDLEMALGWLKGPPSCRMTTAQARALELDAMHEMGDERDPDWK